MEFANSDALFFREMPELMEPYPQKGQYPGLGLYMELHSSICSRILKIKLSKFSKSGFYLKFQDPYSISPHQERKFHLLSGRFHHFEIVPNIFKVDDSIKDERFE